MLENKIKQLNDNLGDEIRKYLEECFNEVIESAYNDLSVDFNDLIKEFHIDEKIVFKKPDIEEMSNSGLCAELSKVELALKENLRELKEQEENSTEEARKALQVQIREKEIQKEAVRNQLFELGGYRARYKDVENEGGEHAGKKIGRAAGEVADIALLLWNPAGAAGTAGKVLKTADTAKDALTAGKLIEKSLIVLKKGQSVVDKVKDKVEENCDETEQTELPTLLDCLSLGFWAEKVGGMIGEKIKPTAELKSVIRSNENLIEIINQIAKKQQEEYENNNVFKQDLLETVKRLLIKHDEIEETTEKKLEDIIDGMLGIKKQNHEFSDYLELVEKSQEKEIQIIERIEKSENEHLENLVNLIDSKIIDKLISVDNNITKFNSRTEKIQQVLDDTVGDLKIQSENIYNILNENVISMLEEDGAICNKLEEVDEKLENIDECLEDAIKDAIQEGLEMGSDKVLESIDNAIEDFNQKNDGMINSYDNLLEKINDVVARLTEDECKIIHEIRLAYKILVRQ